MTMQALLAAVAALSPVQRVALADALLLQAGTSAPVGSSVAEAAAWAREHEGAVIWIFAAQGDPQVALGVELTARCETRVGNSWRIHGATVRLFAAPPEGEARVDRVIFDPSWWLGSTVGQRAAVSELLLRNTPGRSVVLRPTQP